MSNADDRQGQRERFQTLRLASVGLELALSVVIGFFVGYWLDERFDTGPVLSLVFLMLGTVAGMRGLFRVARRAAREEQRREARDAVHSGPDTSKQRGGDTSGGGTGCEKR